MTPYRGYQLFSIKSSVFPQMGCQSGEIIWWVKFKKRRQKKEDDEENPPCSDSVQTHSTDDIEIQLVIIYESLSSAFWLPSSAAFTLSYNKVKRLLTTWMLHYAYTDIALNKEQTRENSFSHIMLMVWKQTSKKALNYLKTLRVNTVINSILNVKFCMRFYCKVAVQNEKKN